MLAKCEHPRASGLVARTHVQYVGDVSHSDFQPPAFERVITPAVFVMFFVMSDVTVSVRSIDLRNIRHWYPCQNNSSRDEACERRHPSPPTLIRLNFIFRSNWVCLSRFVVRRAEDDPLNVHFNWGLWMVLCVQTAHTHTQL